MIDSILKFEIADGRVFIGKLLAMDNKRNLVVGDTVEYSKGDKNYIVRKTGMIMISGKDLVNVWRK